MLACKVFFSTALPEQIFLCLYLKKLLLVHSFFSFFLLFMYSVSKKCKNMQYLHNICLFSFTVCLLIKKNIFPHFTDSLYTFLFYCRQHGIWVVLRWLFKHNFFASPIKTNDSSFVLDLLIFLFCFAYSVFSYDNLKLLIKLDSIS